MARAMGRPDLLENPKYKTNALRHANVDALETDMETTLKQKTTTPVARHPRTPPAFPAARSTTWPAVTNDPQVAARNMIVSIADPKIGKLQVAGNPIKLSGVPEPAEHAAPPEIDADREAILDLICEQV